MRKLILTRWEILARLFVFALTFCLLTASTSCPGKSSDEDLQSLIREKAGKFTVQTFSDDVTDLAIKYSIYLPEGYSSEKKYPVVFFMADASAAGKAPEYSLTQGYGALVWPLDCIVIVPTYPVMILDDHDGFVLTDYVELTGRFVRRAVRNYSVDTSRVYATGQSMGCMTWLILAAKYPGLFTACVFVSGQWNITDIQGLVGQRFIYAASLGDDKASKGQQELIDFFTEQGFPFVHYKDVDAKAPALTIPAEQEHTFITFKAGTTLPAGTKGRRSEHMSSFDYVYRIAAVREWLLAQKGE